VRTRADSRPLLRIVLSLAVIVAVNTAALAITYRAVVLHGRTLTTSLQMPGNEGGGVPWGYPATHRTYANGLSIDSSQPESIFDPAASAWQQEPWTTKASAQLHDGRVPLWSPNAGFGSPLLAAAQGGFLNPVNWPLLLRPSTGMWDATLLARLLIGGILMSIFAWYLGMRVLIASSAGVVFMLSGQFIGHVNNIETSVSVLLPLVLLGLEMCARAPSRRTMLVTATGVALTILAGMPEETFLCLLIAAVYGVVRLGGTAWEQRRLRPLALRAGAMGAGAVLGIGLALPLLLPLAEYLNAGVTGHSPGMGSGMLALDWHQLPQVLAPRWVPLQTNQWFGIAATFLALLGIRARVLPRAVGVTMLLVAAVATLKEYGVPESLNDFIGTLPVMERIFFFRYFGVGASLGVALLAGAALQRMVDRRPPIRWWELTGALVVIGTGLYALGTLQKPAITMRDHHLRIVVATVALLLVLAVVVVLSRWAAARRPAALLAGTSMVVEMVLIASPIGPLPMRFPLFPTTPTSAYMTSVMPTGSGRAIFTVDAMAPDIQDAYNYDSPLLVDAIFPERTHRYIRRFIRSDYVDLFAWDNPRLDLFDNPYVDAADVTYVLAHGSLQDKDGPPPPGQLSYVTQLADGVSVYRNTRGMARANVYYDVETASGEDDTVFRMTAPGYDPRRVAVVEGTSLPSSDAAPAPAQVTSYRDDGAVIDVDTPRPGLLVLTDVYFPGWVATVDGHDATIHPANLAFRGIVVPAGHHTVVMSYKPSSWPHGLEGAAASLIAFMLAAYAVPSGIARWRRSRAA
jgi:hypothetical protein